MLMDLSTATSLAAPGQAIPACNFKFLPTSGPAAASVARAQVMEFEASSALVEQGAGAAGTISCLDWPDVVVRGLLGVQSASANPGR